MEDYSDLLKKHGYVPDEAPDYSDLLKKHGFKTQEKEEEAPSRLESAALGAVQSVTMDFADELEGLAKSALTSKTYTEARDEARARYEAAQKANPGSYLAGGLAGGVLLPGVAGAKLGKAVLGSVAAPLAAEFAGGALLGAASGVGQAKTLDEIPDEAAAGALVGGLFSGAIGAVAPLLKRKGVAKEASKLLAPEEGMLLAGAIRKAEASPTLTVEGLGTLRSAAEKGDESAKRFFDSVQKLTKTDGEGLAPETLVDLYNNNHRFNEALREETFKRVQELDPDLAKAESLFSNKVVAGGDVHRLAARLDELTKTTDIKSAVEGVYTSVNKAQTDLAARLSSQEAKDAVLAVPKLSSVKEKVAFMRDAEAGKLPEFSNYFKNLREDLNKNYGYKIPEVKKTDAVKVYVPQKMTSRGDVYTQINEAIKAGGLEGEVTGALNHLVPENLRFTDKTPYSPERAKALLDRWFATDTGFDKRLVQTNNALLERNEFVPRLLRDLNPQSLVTRYTNEALKTANLRGSVFNLLAQSQALEDAGLEAAAKAVKDYAAGVAGEAGLVPRITQRVADQWKKTVSDLGLPKPLESVPDLMHFLSSQIYPSTMGIPNVASPLRNLSQTFSSAAPEVGGAYGYGLLARSWGALSNLAEAKKSLKARGLLTEHLQLENVGEHGAGLAGRPGFAWTEKVGKANQFLMTFQTLTETVNRSVASKMGDKWAEDLVKGSAGALKALSKAPSSVQGKARVLLGNEDLKGLQDLLATHLVTRSQFIYGSAGASKFTRELGPVLSMFTKYPVNVATDLALGLTNKKDFVRLFERYGAALTLAVAANQVAEDQGLFETRAGRVLFGRSLLGYAPAISPPSTPPIVSLGIELKRALTPEKEKKSLQLRYDEGDSKLERLGAKVAPFLPVVGTLQQGYKTYVKDLEK